MVSVTVFAALFVAYFVVLQVCPSIYLLFSICFLIREGGTPVNRLCGRVSVRPDNFFSRLTVVRDCSVFRNCPALLITLIHIVPGLFGSFFSYVNKWHKASAPWHLRAEAPVRVYIRWLSGNTTRRLCLKGGGILVASAP